jgi:hypothetical protein
VCGWRVVRSLKGSFILGGPGGRLGWVMWTLDAVGAEALKDALEMMSANWLDSALGGLYILADFCYTTGSEIWDENGIL